MSRVLIDLRKGHPKARNLQHARLARACRAAASRLDLASEAALRMNYTVGGAGTPRFLSSLARFLSSAYQSPVFADGLLTTNGVSHGIDLACNALTSPGDTVLIEQPSYFLARQIFIDHHLSVVGVPRDVSGHIDTEALEARLVSGSIQPPPRLMYLVPSHGNPSGASIPLSGRQQLVQLAERFGFFLLCDDVYHLLHWGGGEERSPPLPRLLELDSAHRVRVERGGPAAAAAAPRDAAAAAAAATSTHRASGEDSEEDDPAYRGGSSSGATGGPAEGEGVVISLGSFTKILAPGLRLGWVEASSALLARLEGRGYITSGGSVAPFASEIVSEMLGHAGGRDGGGGDGGGDSWRGCEQDEVLRDLCADYRVSCEAVCDELERAASGFVFERPSGGFFVWVRLPAGVSATALLPVAEQRHGVAFLPGPVCAPDAEEGAYDGYVRLCFAWHEPEELREGVRRLAAAVREMRGKRGR